MLLAGMVALAAATGGSDLTAGPVMAGDGAAWAERTRSGAARVVTRQLAGRRIVRRRWAQPRDARSDRSVVSIAASGSRLAAVVDTCTLHRRFAPVAACVGRAFSGPFARVRGPRLPARVPQRCPERGRRTIREVATSGGWVARRVERSCPPMGIESAATRAGIEVSGPRTRRIPLRMGGGLRLAGDFLAWSNWNGGVVLYDLRRGEVVRKIGNRRGSVGGYDVQADGTLALARYVAGGRICVTTLPLAGVEREVACRYEEGSAGDGDAPGARTAAVAISAGRVLYLSGGFDLILQRPGGEPRRMTRFSAERLRAGAFDVGPRSVVWGEQRSDTTRVVLKRL